MWKLQTWNWKRCRLTWLIRREASHRMRPAISIMDKINAGQKIEAVWLGSCLLSSYMSGNLDASDVRWGCPETKLTLKRCDIKQPPSTLTEQREHFLQDLIRVMEYIRVRTWKHTHSGLFQPIVCLCHFWILTLLLQNKTAPQEKSKAARERAQKILHEGVEVIDGTTVMSHACCSWKIGGRSVCFHACVHITNASMHVYMHNRASTSVSIWIDCVCIYWCAWKVGGRFVF